MAKREPSPPTVTEVARALDALERYGRYGVQPEPPPVIQEEQAAPSKGKP